MEKILAPIVYFAYNRPNHTLQTLEALSNCRLAEASDLFIYVDGPKATATEKDLEAIAEIKKIVGQKKWCKNVTITIAEQNKGLARSITEGVTKGINQYGKVIVLEDDILVSTGFLEYMNDALDLYENTPSVMHISAFSLPEFKDMETNESTFFFNHTSCWGWGTWKRAWDLFDNDALRLLKRVKKRDVYRLNMDGTLEIFWALKAIAKGKRHNWNSKWHTTVFLNGGLCLHPFHSLVENIGHDGSGVNCAPNSVFETENRPAEKVIVTPITLQENKAIRKFHNKLRSKERAKVFFKHYLRYLRFWD